MTTICKSLSCNPVAQQTQSAQSIQQVGPVSVDSVSSSDLPVLPQVIIGVDTHKDNHVGAVLTLTGQVLATKSFPTTVDGYHTLLSWACSLGRITHFGIEGTGSYGKQLTSFIRIAGYNVIEVNRGNRQTRRQLGKTDTIDAITAARSVLSGQAITIPKTCDGSVEMIRQLQVIRDNIVKNTTEITNIFKDMILSAPENIREMLKGKTFLRQAKICAQLSSDPTFCSDSIIIRNLIRLSTRWLSLRSEAQEIDNEIRELVKRTKPQLLNQYGIGTEVAATILTAVGDNPERIRSDAALAKLAGVCPIPASSGKTHKHRLNRGGNRKLNNAIHTIALTRMRSHQETRNYVTKRLAEGKTLREIRRILKRYITRHIYHILQQPTQNTTQKLDQT